MPAQGRVVCRKRWAYHRSASNLNLTAGVSNFTGVGRSTSWSGKHVESSACHRQVSRLPGCIANGTIDNGRHAWDARVAGHISPQHALAELEKADVEESNRQERSTGEQPPRS